MGAEKKANNSSCNQAQWPETKENGSKDSQSVSKSEETITLDGSLSELQSSVKDSESREHIKNPVRKPSSLEELLYGRSGRLDTVIKKKEKATKGEQAIMDFLGSRSPVNPNGNLRTSGKSIKSSGRGSNPQGQGQPDITDWLANRKKSLEDSAKQCSLARMASEAAKKEQRNSDNVDDIPNSVAEPSHEAIKSNSNQKKEDAKVETEHEIMQHDKQATRKKSLDEIFNAGRTMKLTDFMKSPEKKSVEPILVEDISNEIKTDAQATEEDKTDEDTARNPNSESNLLNMTSEPEQSDPISTKTDNSENMNTESATQLGEKLSDLSFSVSEKFPRKPEDMFEGITSDSTTGDSRTDPSTTDLDNEGALNIDKE